MKQDDATREAARRHWQDLHKVILFEVGEGDMDNREYWNKYGLPLFASVIVALALVTVAAVTGYGAVLGLH